MKFIFKFPRADAESIVTEGNTYGEAADKAIAERVRLKIACMHDPYDLRCPVCGHSVFSHLSGAAYACEGCGVQLSLFPDKAGCRLLMEVQGA
jgi:ribosomal protein L37AE/L43A